MSAEEDEWVLVALRDDTLVAQFLLQLNHASTLRQKQPCQPPPPLKWSVKQRRSRTVYQQQQQHRRTKCGEATRASPTTPLSWSGATSLSGGGGGVGGGALGGGADGFEESSVPAMKIQSSRSKGAGTSVTPATKRSRKKKTLAELKEEESFLLKERRNLKNQLAKLRLTVDKERATNESLKRIKLESLSRQTEEAITVSVGPEVTGPSQCQQTKAANDPLSVAVPTSAPCNKLDASDTLEHGWTQHSFALPDLNLPVDGDSNSSDVLYGLR